MKIARQNKIIELINKFDIETQDDLADRLMKEGFKVTQATVSRDIRDLKLMKMTNEDGKQKYIIVQSSDLEMSDKYRRVLRDGFVSIDRAENILVIKTVSGMAMAVAAALDSMEWREIVGCIAGDDTIMAAIRTKEDALPVMERIRRLIINKK